MQRNSVFNFSVDLFSEIEDGISFSVNLPSKVYFPVRYFRKEK